MLIKQSYKKIVICIYKQQEVMFCSRVLTIHVYNLHVYIFVQNGSCKVLHIKIFYCKDIINASTCFVLTRNRSKSWGKIFVTKVWVWTALSVTLTHFMCARVTNTCRIWWMKEWVSFETSEIEEELFHNIENRYNAIHLPFDMEPLYTLVWYL